MHDAPRFPLAALFLEDGAQTAPWVGRHLADFLAGARRSLDIAIYDLRLEGPVAASLVEAIQGVRTRGVEVRLVFNVEHGRPIPVPPPSAVDFDLVRLLGVPFRPVEGVPDLMHHKYAVRDAATPEGSVLTGSANWTTDSWARQENVIVRIDSPPLAEIYARNFEELWARGSVGGTGHIPPEWVEPVGGPRMRAFFTPGMSNRLVHELSHRLGSAGRRVRLCSPVVTAGPILGTVAELLERPQLDLRGVFDLTQMESVLAQWRAAGIAGWKVGAFEAMLASGRFAGKRSTPYQPGSVHDFMHAKLAVADDTVFIGSYNLSSSGEENAENVIEVEHPGLADMCARFVDHLADRYELSR